MTHFLSRFVLAILLPASAAVTAPVSAENWPQWRGSRRDGVSKETDVATIWSTTENIVWRKPLPGPAGATPVVWGERIFLTTADKNNLDLLCISTDGKMLWRQNVTTGNRGVRGDEANLASASPSTDGKHVWCVMGNGVIACFDVDGKRTWRFNLGERYGELDLAFGYTSTPVLDGERIYVQWIHGDGDPETGEATVICLDKATGKEIWHRLRASDAVKECEHSYASPVLYRHGTTEYLLSHGADFIVAHNLGDGEELWRCGGLNPKSQYNPTLRLVASPLATGDLIVVPSAKNGPIFGIRPTAKGDVTGSKKDLYWSRPNNTPDVPSPLYHDGLVYLCRENGNLLCLDARSGEEIYYERTVRDRHRASPLYADGKIFLTSRRGVVTVVQPGREFKILAQNSLDEPITASPIVANGTLYLRTFEALYAIRNDVK